MASATQIAGMAATSMRIALAVAAITGALLGGLATVLWDETAVAWVGVSVATFAAVIVVPVDLQQHRIPNRVTYPVLALLLAFILAGAICGRSPQTILTIVVIAAAVLTVGLLASRFGTLGLGDVKLAVVLALGFGALGAMAVVGLFVVAVIVNGAIAALLLVTKRKTRKDYLPYAPALAIGAVVTVCLQALQIQ